MSRQSEKLHQSAKLLREAASTIMDFVNDHVLVMKAGDVHDCYEQARECRRLAGLQIRRARHLAAKGK